MKKFIEINGTLRAPAYIGNIYYMGGEKITMQVLISDKKSFAPEVVELSPESEKLVADTIKELAKEVKASKPSPANVAPKAPAASRSRAPAKKAPAAAPAKPASGISTAPGSVNAAKAGEIPLV